MYDADSFKSLVSMSKISTEEVLFKQEKRFRMKEMCISLKLKMLSVLLGIGVVLSVFESLVICSPMELKYILKSDSFDSFPNVTR